MKIKCEYCTFDEQDPDVKEWKYGKAWKDIQGFKNNVGYDSQTKSYFLATFFDMSGPIEYCPKCGRKLSEDSDE